MVQSKIKPEILHEIDSVLQDLRDNVIGQETNIDEVCAIINRGTYEGALWTFIHCYADAEEEDLILFNVVVEGTKLLLEIPLKGVSQGFADGSSSK